MDKELSVCEELYASALAMREMFGYAPTLFEHHVQAFKRSKTFRRWLFDEGVFCPKRRKGIFQPSPVMTCHAGSWANSRTISLMLIASGPLRNS
jgi:hypothetical protein